MRGDEPLDFALVNILTINDSEDKDVKIQQGMDNPVVPDAILAKAGKRPLQYRVGFRMFDQFVLNEIEDSFRLGLRQLLEVPGLPYKDRQKRSPAPDKGELILKK